jgi:hypothetical protein
MSRICEYCRSELPSDAQYCPHCGAELGEQTAPMPKPSVYLQPTQQPSAVTTDKQTLSITAFVLALAGLMIGITFIPGLIVGLIALKKEPKGKTFAWIAVGLSGGVLLIVIVLVITTLIQIAAAPRPWY